MTFSMQRMRSSLQASDGMSRQIFAICDSQCLTNSFIALHRAFLLILSSLAVPLFVVLPTSLLRLLAA